MTAPIYTPRIHRHTAGTPSGGQERVNKVSEQARLAIELEPLPDTFNMWRYNHLLGLGTKRVSYPLEVGGTPLLALEPLRNVIGLPHLFIKDETRGPTCSNKDRATALVLELALRAGQRTVTTASTGNAAISLAFGAAACGMTAVIFVGPSVRRDKLHLIQLAGATVFIVRSSYEDAVELSRQAAVEFGWADRNTGHNPKTFDGKKTAAFEIWEQLGYVMPDVLIAPVGDGTTAGSLFMALRQLQNRGAKDTLPRIIGVQAATCDPLVRQWSGRSELMITERPAVLADGLAVSKPAAAEAALEAVRATSGTFLSVTDIEIVESMRILAAGAGLMSEPSGAVALAGARSALRRGIIRPRETIVALLTGARMGMESYELPRGAPTAHSIGPKLIDVQRTLGRSTNG